MPWTFKSHAALFVIFLDQNPPGSGHSLEMGSYADWANVVVAFVGAVVAVAGFGFAISSYRDQQQKNREAAAEQQQKEQAARLELEQARQQSIRLAWYRDAVKPSLEKAYAAFAKLHEVKQQIKSADLSEDQKDELFKAYTQAVYTLRNELLERIVFIHRPTYDKLKAELDQMFKAVQVALFNDSLKLTHEDTYEQFIGGRIRGCQSRFFQILYAYQGEEHPENTASA